MSRAKPIRHWRGAAPTAEPTPVANAVSIESELLKNKRPVVANTTSAAIVVKRSSEKKPEAATTAAVIVRKSSQQVTKKEKKSESSSSSSSSSSSVVRQQQQRRVAESSSSSSSDSDEADQRRARARARARSASLAENNDNSIAAVVVSAASNGPARPRDDDSSSSSSSSSPKKKNVDPKKEESSSSASSASGSSSGSSSRSGSSSSCSGSYDSDSESDGAAQAMSFRPVFAKKNDRDARAAGATAVAAKADDADGDELDSHAKQQASLKALRREQARGALLEDIRQEEQNKLAARQQSSADDGVDLDPTEPAEREAEYAAWRLRELSRMKRELDERRKVDGDAAEILRRRKMTDEEVMIEDAELLASQKKSGKNGMRFMQSYYHEGAFFREGDGGDILAGRDFTAPSEQDRVDKSILPKAMQVRRDFGHAGHSKYTNLKDEDTTDRNALWFGDRKLADNYKSKMSGTRGVSDRDGERKKRRTGEE